MIARAGGCHVNVMLAALLLLSTASLDEARRLAGEKKYESAMAMLDELERKPAVLVERIKVALDGYAICVQGDFFALRDLEPGETIERVRGAPGSYKMHALNVTELQKSAPEDAELLTWLGHLAYFRAHQCGPSDANDAQARSLYERAQQLGAGSGQLRRNLALIYLQERNATKAVPLLRASVADYVDDPQFEYNFGYALYMEKSREEALPHVERAFHLYKDQKLVSEAALLAAFIAWDLKDRKKALEMASQADKHKSENYYSIYTKLFGLYGEMGEWPKAKNLADRLFELDPKNPRLAQDVIEGYAELNRPGEVDGFFARQLKKQHSNQEAIGNLLFHRGQWNAQNARRAQARADLLKAREHFAKVLPANHQVFTAIEANLKGL